MIKVTRQNNETNQNLFGTFFKRVRSSKNVARAKKTQIMPEPMSHYKKHKKAIKKVKFLAARKLKEKIGKK